MNHYLDSSVVVALLLPDAHSFKADAWLTRTTPTFTISDFCKVEFAAVISRRARMKGLTASDAAVALGKFDSWLNNGAEVVTCGQQHMASAESLVRDFSSKLSAPDAIHLAIASENSFVLVTFDERLAQAAQRHNIPVVVPS